MTLNPFPLLGLERFDNRCLDFVGFNGIGFNVVRLSFIGFDFLLDA
jgi:hypothetical protein